MATNYLRKGIRNPSTYVWVNKRAELSRQSQQNDLASHGGIRREKQISNPVQDIEIALNGKTVKKTVLLSKTAHDIINEYREKGLHLIDIL